MIHKTANNPEGVDLGAVSLIDTLHHESVLAIPTSFAGKQEFRTPQQQEHAANSLAKAREIGASIRRER